MSYRKRTSYERFKKFRDSQGNLVKQYIWTYDDGVQLVEEQTYASKDRLIKREIRFYNIQGGLESRETKTYNDQGKLAGRETLNFGLVKVSQYRAYDGEGNLIKEKIERIKES